MTNNLDEYLTPEIYDAEYGKYKDDFDLFLSSKSNGNALDLACGTGRITMALAQAGFEKVIGLDASLPMLERARTKTKNFNIQFIQGNIQNFNLHEKFDHIVMAGNAFQALLTSEQQISMLSQVKKHLKPNALFIFDTRNPKVEDFKTTNDFEYWHNFYDKKEQKVIVSGMQICDKNSQIIKYTTKRVWPNGQQTMTDIELKFTSHNEIIQILNESGFDILDIYGNKDKIPYHSTCPSIIPVCRLKLV